MPRSKLSRRADVMTVLDLPLDDAPLHVLGAPATLFADEASVNFLGVGYDRVSMAEAVSLILARQPEAPFASVVTPNAAHVVRIASDRPVARAYDNAWLCINDSRVVELLARTRGVALTATPGSDLLVALLADDRFDPASPVLLVGGDDELLEMLTTKARLTAASQFKAPMGLMEDPAALQATVEWIETHPARFVLLAVGSPQQELIAETLRSRGIARGVGLCIGASVEFLTGRRRRAPVWMSRGGIEWLFRLVSEPRRMWRRYLVDSPAIFGLYLKELRR